VHYFVMVRYAGEDAAQQLEVMHRDVRQSCGKVKRVSFYKRPDWATRIFWRGLVELAQQVNPAGMQCVLVEDCC